MKTVIALLLIAIASPASAKMWVANDLASAEANVGIIAIFSEGDGFRLETNEHVYHCDVDGSELACDRASPKKTIEFLSDDQIRIDGETFTVQR